MNFSITRPVPMCQECGKEFDSLRGLHGHVARKEGGLEAYYHKHYPRRDLYTTDLIDFKNAKSYCKAFFNSRSNEKKWALDNDAKEWYTFKIKNLIKKPDHKYAYSWVEWVSLGNLEFEDINGFEEVLGSAGLQKRFDYGLPDEYSKMVDEELILVDTREQRPLFNNKKTSINVGDYALRDTYYNGIHIDRKSLPDFISTFTAGLDRFNKEAEKAKSIDAYLVVLVENDFYDCFAYRPNKRFGQRVDGKLAFLGARSLMQRYDNIQFLFVGDRNEAKNAVRWILANPELKNKDLQYLYYVDRRISL